MQDSETAGPHKTTVTPDGIVCENQKAGIVLASRAPKWDVLVYNKKSKTYCVVPLAQFRGEMNSKLYDSDRVELKMATWRFDGPSKNLGHDLLRYLMIPSAKLKAKKDGSSFFSQGKYWCFKNIQLPKQSQELFAKIFQVPSQFGGLPFGLIVIDASGSSFENLKTLRIEPASNPSVPTKPPSGFALKKKLEDVMVDSLSKEVFDSMADMADPKLDKKK